MGIGGAYELYLLDFVFHVFEPLAVSQVGSRYLSLILVMSKFKSVARSVGKIILTEPTATIPLCKLYPL